MKVLVTAGPTYERIDPVRFIGNFSTGKMGFAIAEAFAELGHDVVLVCGPVQLKSDNPRIRRIDVESAEEMYNAVMAEFPSTDGAVLCAAVADFRPVNVADRKIKREGSGNLIIELEPTRDIAAAVGKVKRNDQFMVGFALETNDEEVHALDKMKRKNLDFIVMNSLRDKGAGFGYDTNKVTYLFADGRKMEGELKSKKEVGREIADLVTNLR